VRVVRKGPNTMDEYHFKLLGGQLALDFANTASWHARAEPGELLTDYARVLAWGEQAGALDAAARARLATAAERDPAGVAVALARIVALREVIYRLFSALAAGRPLPAADLAALNGALAATLPHLCVLANDTAPVWGWAEAGEDFSRPIWPVIRAAAELLTAPDRALVRECAGEDCGWLFLDTSRNRTRRWCDSRDCGNRMRVRQHYARQRARDIAEVYTSGTTR